MPLLIAVFSGYWLLQLNFIFHMVSLVDASSGFSKLPPYINSIFLPCLLSSVGMGWIPNPTVFLIGSMRVKAVFNICLAVGTPEP